MFGFITYIFVCKRAEVYLELSRASTVELFWESKKLHRRCSTGWQVLLWTCALLQSLHDNTCDGVILVIHIKISIPGAFQRILVTISDELFYEIHPSKDFHLVDNFDLALQNKLYINSIRFSIKNQNFEIARKNFNKLITILPSPLLTFHLWFLVI